MTGADIQYVSNEGGELREIESPAPISAPANTPAASAPW
jgi:hypothetical protein